MENIRDSNWTSRGKNYNVCNLKYTGWNDWHCKGESLVDLETITIEAI